MDIFVNYIFPIFSMVLGILILNTAGFLYFNNRDIDSWIQTRGRIIKSGIKRNGLYFYSPVVHFKYEVYGVEYQGLNINLDGKQTSKYPTAQAWIAPYTTGKEVDVFYNPEKPRMAVLEKNISIGNMVVVTLSGIFLITTGLFDIYLQFIYR